MKKLTKNERKTKIISNLELIDRKSLHVNFLLKEIRDIKKENKKLLEDLRQ